MGRQVVEVAEPLEPFLERGADLGGGTRADEQAANRLQRPAAVAALANPLDLTEAQQLESVGFLPGCFELAKMHDFGEVEQGARDGGDGDAGLYGAVLLVQAPAMQADIEPPGPVLAATRGGDVDSPAALSGEPPEGCSAAMAEQRSLPTRQHRRQPMAALTHPRVANRIRLAVQSVKPPGPQPSLDNAPFKTESQQLTPSHNPVLLGRQPR